MYCDSKQTISSNIQKSCKKSGSKISSHKDNSVDVNALGVIQHYTHKQGVSKEGVFKNCLDIAKELWNTEKIVQKPLEG